MPTEAPKRIQVHSSVLFPIDDDGKPFTAEVISTEEDDGSGFLVGYVSLAELDAAVEQAVARTWEAAAKVAEICTCESGPEWRSVNMRHHRIHCSIHIATMIRAAAAKEK